MTETPTSELPAVLTVLEAAKVLRVGRDRVYELVKSEGFPVIHMGWKYLIPRDALLWWIEKQAHGHSPQS